MIHTWLVMFRRRLLDRATTHPVAVIAACAAMLALLLGALAPLFLD